MFNSLKIGWYAANIGERIESSMGYIIDSLILMGIHIKTHDTIYVFSQIYSFVTHNMFGKLLDQKGQNFINKLDQRLKFDEKNWLKKITQVPMDITTVKSFEVFFDEELDEYRNKWLEEHIRIRKSDPNASAGSFTFNCIEKYLLDLGHELPKSFYELEDHFMRLDEVAKE